MTTETPEIWRPVVGFPDYAVSSKGRVKRAVPDARNHTCRVIVPWIGNHRYETVGLSVGGKVHRRLVHRLVCEAFHGPAPTAAHQAAHCDGTRRNNAAANLRWATRSENMADCLIHGTRAAGPRHGRTLSPEKTPRGERHGHAKLQTEDIQAIRSASREPGSGRALARTYGVSAATISLIRAGKIWRHV